MIKPDLGFPSKDAEEAKLVEFFRSAEGAALGRDGDYDNLSPAETAIRAMRKLLRGVPENHGPVAPGGVGVIDLAARSPVEIGRDERCPPLSRDYEIARLQTKLRRIGYEDLGAQACHQIARQALAGFPDQLFGDERA